MAEQLDNAIKQNAEGPESAGADGMSIQQHPLADQIAAASWWGSSPAAELGAK